MDSLARKAAQQIAEELQGMPHDCDVCGAELVESMESIIESALAPMREALKKSYDAMDMVLAILCDKSLCGHFLPEEIREQLEPVVARAAEVLKGQ